MITLFSAATANGQKAAIALEEAALPYRKRMLDLSAGEHLDADVLSLNPVGRIPFIEMQRDDAPHVIYGTLPIALFAAETSGRLLPVAGPDRYVAIQWAAFAATDVSHVFANQFILENMLGLADREILGFIHNQIGRMLGIMEQRLREKDYLAGDDYTVADVLAYPIAATSAKRLPKGLDGYPAMAAWAGRLAQRPGVVRGMQLE